MNFNFFDWMRDGVKRSVLMGVSDAVQTIGMPQDEESSKDKILSFLRDDNSVVDAKPRRLPGSSPSGSSRKLGKSIAEIGLVRD
jgi:hypothetical protein